MRETAASLDATEVVIGTLRPLLAGRGALPPVETGLLGLRRELDAVRSAHGGRLPATRALGRGEREALSGSLGAALERLAAVAARSRPACLRPSRVPSAPWRARSVPSGNLSAPWRARSVPSGNPRRRGELGADSMKLDRRRFLTRSALLFGAGSLAAAETVADAQPPAGGTLVERIR